MEEDTFAHIHKEQFENDFIWGVSTAAYQIEGGHNADGKGSSIWDSFSSKKGKIKNGHNGNIACDFYNRFEDDLALIKQLNIPNFRFSISWSRILPNGTGTVNPAGITYYNRLINSCIELGIVPWATLYHWDLPQALEDKGGWANREIINWFREYVKVCAVNFGDRVKHWMVMNEPAVFTGAGYYFGIHAPGKKGLKNYLPTIHHTVLSIAEGGRELRKLLPDAEIGTTFSCTHIHPVNSSPRHINAAKRIDVLFNRMFIEPLLGLGYPVEDLHFLRKLQKYILPGDEQKLVFDFDFIGLQNYTREVVKHSLFVPYLQASLVKAEKRNVPVTDMNWEVYPEGLYKILKKFNAYTQIKKIYITENGAAFSDKVINGEVNDPLRIDFLQRYLKQLLKAKQEGYKVKGYFIWTLTDNFEWAEGYNPRFGIVHVDFETQERTIKNSGKWYRQFLKDS